ncbi:MAG: hypothetical protein FJ317_06665, partial [SAR202 cluster bacterium]|nr:hypothetical protein [SAR202 cluster bacterium]
VHQIPQEFLDWMGVNAREPSLKGRVPKEIRATLIENQEWFSTYNRGLSLLAEDVKYDNQSNLVYITFTDKKEHGVFDGGHTLSVILSENSSQSEAEVPEDEQAYCRLEILTGIPSGVITDLVEARNTSRQVASKSLLNLDGRFKELKQVLGARLSSQIAWKENEDAPVDVREVIALFTALNRDHYNDVRHPIVAYSGKEACLKQFDDHEESYRKLYPVAKDILELWEKIQLVVPEQYNKETGGRFGGLKGCKNLKRPRSLPLIGAATNYPFPNGYLYPIVGAFRSMLEESGGTYIWGKGINPVKAVEQGLAAKIFSGPIFNSIQAYHNPNRTGKDTNVWAFAYQMAENYYLRVK